jgi:hypothetical protein
MCRELHDPLIRHEPVSIKTKNTFQTIYFFQRLPTRFSTAFQEPHEMPLKQAFGEFLRGGWLGDVLNILRLIAKRIVFDCVFDLPV